MRWRSGRGPLDGGEVRGLEIRLDLPLLFSVPGVLPVPNWQIFDGILYVLRTGCQWHALRASGFEGIRPYSTGVRRFTSANDTGIVSILFRRQDPTLLDRVTV